MLTSGSSSQYLHPEYLQPLPTTLDAKKSPLALLAQTCSSIGKDPSPSKSIIPPIDKKDKEALEKSEPKRPSSINCRGSNGESGRDSKPGFRTVPSRDISPFVGDEKGAKDSLGDAKHASCGTTCHGLTNTSSSSSSSSHILNSSSSTFPITVASSSSQRPSSHSGSGRENSDYSATPPGSVSGNVIRLSASTSPPRASSSSSSSALPAHSSHSAVSKGSTSHPSLLPLAHSYGAAFPHFSLLSGLDPALHCYHTALAAQSGLASLSAAAAAQSSALKGAGGSALSPFVAYARVQTPSGATTLVPVCRDPYCTNCKMTLQNSHLSSACTTPGCSQCAHEKSLATLTSSALEGLGGASLPVIPPLTSTSALSGSLASMTSLGGLYPLAAHQGVGYMCSWVAGSEYCGKRFANSDELMQHLRTHTSSGVDPSALAAYGALALHPGLVAAAAAGCPSHYPRSSLSPNSLRRTYSTSASPVSSLLTTNRYHPYKSPFGSVPPAPTAQGLAAVSSYYSPYMYGQRIGAAAVP